MKWILFEQLAEQCGHPGGDWVDTPDGGFQWQSDDPAKEKAAIDRQIELAAAEVRKGVGVVLSDPDLAWRICHKASGEPNNRDIEIAQSIKDPSAILVFRMSPEDMGIDADEFAEYADRKG